MIILKYQFNSRFACVSCIQSSNTNWSYIFCIRKKIQPQVLNNNCRFKKQPAGLWHVPHTPVKVVFCCSKQVGIYYKQIVQKHAIIFCLRNEITAIGKPVISWRYGAFNDVCSAWRILIQEKQAIQFVVIINCFNEVEKQATINAKNRQSSHSIPTNMLCPKIHTFLINLINVNVIQASIVRFLT